MPTARPELCADRAGALPGDDRDAIPPRLELLIKAAVSSGDTARRAWMAWRGHGPFPKPDSASRRILPLVSCNLRRIGVAPLPPRLERAYRATWARNVLRFRDLATVLQAFNGAGIPTIVLKGAALVVAAYRDYGARPMDDADVLVPAERAAEAIDLLKAAGWDSPLGRPERLVGVRHADEFRRGPHNLDLHWSVLQECCRSGDNDDFWNERQPVSINGVPTSVLCPADQLLHVLVHGARSGPAQPAGWLTDALTLLGSSGIAVDWDRLVAQSTARGLVVPVREALRLLSSTFQAPVPGEVLTALSREDVSRTQQLEYRTKRNRRRLVGSLPVLWFDYARWARGTTAGRLTGFPRYLQVTFRTKSLWGLPGDVVRLTLQRVRSFGVQAKPRDSRRERGVKSAAGG
jgi:hypothetical protein